MGPCFDKSEFANFDGTKKEVVKVKKRILALILSVAMCTMMCETAFAASSSTSGSSSTETSTESVSTPAPAARPAAEAPATRGTENTDNIAVAVKNADGTVSTVNLTQYTEQTNSTVVAAAAAAVNAGGQNPGEAVSKVLTAPASDVFKATINALGGNIRMVNAGGYRVTAVAPGADGRKVASVGTVKGVTKYAFVILISVNEDGTIETVEGTVDPVTLQVMGAFKGTPKTITVSVIMAK